MSTTEPEALRWASELETFSASEETKTRNSKAIAIELRRLHADIVHADRYAEQLGRELAKAGAEIADLRAQLASIGAGGVSGPLIGQPQTMPDLTAMTERGAKAWAGVDAQGLREIFTAADMATAAAQGFRDGVASVAANAGSEPVKPEDYVPLLDDEGRMMVGTSHHYTAENIRALVQQLRRFADPQQSTQADWDALDWRGWCNVLGRIVAALADEVPVTHPSPPEGMAGWKPIADAPEDEPVLLWSEIKGGAPILDAWGRYMQYNQPQFTHFMLVRPPLASEAKEAGHADQA